MKRIVSATLCVVFSLALVLPAFAQGGENAAWQNIQDTRDKRRQAELLTSFISSYSSSPNRPEADKMLVSYWLSNNDFAKIMNWADGFRQSLPSADKESKSIIYTQGMVSAAQLNNINKTKEFAEYALQADPNNFMVLAFMASSNLLDPQKTQEYAKKAATLPMPKTMQAKQYESLLARVKTISAGNAAPAANNGAAAAPAGPNPIQAMLNAKKYPEAIEALTQVVQTNPRDHAAHYNIGVANYLMMVDLVRKVQDASDEVLLAKAGKKPQADIDAATVKANDLTKQTMERRDAAIDAMARSIGVGGPNAADAKKIFDALYQNKKGSMEGAEPYLAEKKKEVETSVAATAAAPAKP